MKTLLASLLLVLAMLAPASASESISPQINECLGAEGISRCEVRCARSLGEQCLITHISFEGENLTSGTELFKARFLACKNANLDLQISDLAVELEKLDKRQSTANLQASASASGKKINLEIKDKISFDETRLDANLPRTYFGTFLNSGEEHVEASVTLDQCGHEDGSNSCKIRGRLIAVTDPNIRCDFHDLSQPGAYVLDGSKARAGRLEGGN